ncbi:hypothetical protein [Frankia sp. CiP3]|uniref:hypothetical protein n=1 Tax=Frankia sp. CiP3 TaxID=2880971 RepID=UPI0021070573|nr:hypothetical protein [Frankia sp. CiP3]
MTNPAEESQAEPAQLHREEFRARCAGDDGAATIKRGQNAQLAHQSDNEATYRLLRNMVSIKGPSTGTVRLKRNVDTIDEMVLDPQLTRTVRVNR